MKKHYIDPLCDIVEFSWHDIVTDSITDRFSTTEDETPLSTPSEIVDPGTNPSNPGGETGNT